MPPRNRDLHGHAPDESRVARVLVDVITRRGRVPVVYVNDNVGRWRSDFRALLERCLHRPVRGRPLARRLRPHAVDYVVLKTKHSAFYATTLELLLRYLAIPADCVVSIDPEHNRRALDEMARLFDADLTESTRLAFSRSGVSRRGRARAARPRSARARRARPARRSHAPAA